MQEKTPNQQFNNDQMGDDVIVISGSDTIAGSNDVITAYSNGSMIEPFTVGPIGSIDTVTIDTSTLLSNQYTTSTGISWTDHTYSGSLYNNHHNVNIDSNGITMREGRDIKVDGRSLKDFIDRVEERLAILHPNEALEAKWEQLKDLRRQYEELEKDIIEKEKIMKILKEQ